MTNKLTIILGYRNRDIPRVKRCLDSLKEQTFTDFRVNFVDYGSDATIAEEAFSLVSQYPFCNYIYSETRGYPWNRSQALNIGARLANSNYIMTSDIDMIFPKNFVQTLLENSSSQKVLYCYPHFLPKNFTDWGNIEKYVGRLPIANKDALGGCQMVSISHFKEIQGFDEYYRYWGREDRDIFDRLIRLGLHAEWLNDKTFIFHQWHPEVNHKTSEFMPEGIWGRMQSHFVRFHNEPVRNDIHWGEIKTEDKRPSLGFLDFANGLISDKENVHFLDERPDDHVSSGRLAKCFWELPSGHALVVKHAKFPEWNPKADRLLKLVNRLLYTLGANFRLTYGRNLLHSYLIEYLETNSDIIADYYLDFPAMNGVSILVRA